MKKSILVLFTCAVVALPLSAQGNDEVTGTDSANIEETTDMGKSPAEETSAGTEKTEVEGDNSNDLLIAIFVVSLLSLVVSVLSFIQNKKKMTEKDVKGSSDVALQISDMQQQLLQMRKLMEEMLAKQSSLLGEFVTKLGTVQQIHIEQPIQNQYQQSVSTTLQQDQPRQRHQADLQQKRIETSPQEQTIYVRPSIEGTSIMLTPVSEAYADRATFVIKTSGNKGTYGFNKAATKSIISYLDNMLTPYCDCSLLTNGTVSTVNPTSDGTVEKQGDKWIVINKAQVSVS